MKTLHLLLFTLFFAAAANAQMVLEYELPEAGDSIALPLYGTVDVTVDWGDGLEEVFAEEGDKSHNYSSAGTKTVTITGTLTHFGAQIDTSYRNYITKVISWDGLGIESFKYAFWNAKLLTQVPTSLPVTVANLSYMLRETAIFNQDISTWNTVNVTTMKWMFAQAGSFNKPIGGWDISNVTDISRMFREAKVFNQDLSDWNTSKITNMAAVFERANSFNRAIGTWNTANVTDMGSMFYYNDSFNQPLGDWDISSVTTMYNMFFGSSLCTEIYDSTLNAWASQTVQVGVTFNGGNSKYSAASEVARATLAESWTISDKGLGTNKADKCSSVLSTENLSASGSIEIYPNPVSDKLFINAASLSSYTVYNLTGNLLKETEGFEAEIDLSDLPSGIYILQTASELGIQTQRFTKN